MQAFKLIELKQMTVIVFYQKKTEVVDSLITKINKWKYNVIDFL